MSDPPVEVAEERPVDLAAYARVPIAFEVRSVLDVADGVEGPELVERALDQPYVKDYDAIAGEGPATWARRFDLERWAFFVARLDGRRIGGAAVALDPSLADAREGDAVLWDLRVTPEARGKGVGAALFRAAAAWAHSHGARRLVAETQNVNIVACRFYASQGCILSAVDRLAYPALPHEIRLLWILDLDP